MTALEFKLSVIPAYGTMMAVARSMLGKEEAEDAVQEVFKQLWLRHTELNIKGDVTIFAVRCVRNRCLDILKSPKRTVSFTTNFTSLPTETVDDQATVETTNRLRQEIERLKEPAKSVLSLNLDGKSTEEIAELQGLSAANVRQILSRTRRHLRQLLKS